jgi:transcriptional regulator with XRE-family HTH domain
MHGSLPTRLRVLRAERGLTLRDAEHETGVDKDTLSKIERGLRHPHDVTLAKIAKGYGVPVEDLLEEPKAPRPDTKAEAPQLTREQFANHYVDEEVGILPTNAELAALNQLLKIYTEIAQTGAKRGKFMAPPGVDVGRIQELFFEAVESGMLSPEDVEVLKTGVRARLKAGAK